MRVLVLGTTGIGKRQYIDSVASHITQPGSPEPPSRSADRRRRLRVHCLEDYIRNYHANQPTGQRRTLVPFLNSSLRSSQLEIWRQAAEQLLSDLGTFGSTSDRDEVSFLLLHGNYYRSAQLFSSIHWDHLLRYGPHLIITLIDDIYDVHARITEREQQFKTQATIDINGLLIWRSAEITLGDALARNLYLDRRYLNVSTVPRQVRHLFRNEPLPHYVVATKHHPQTLHRLITEPNTLHIYASFPVSSTRGYPDRVAEINRFRLDIINHFAVFDPITIDELRGAPPNLTRRWPLGYTPAVSMIPDSFKPRTRDHHREVIRAQLQERDLRLAQSATCVAAYRPFWGGRKEPARGVAAEVGYALAVANEAVIFHPEEDGTMEQLQSSSGIFGTMANVTTYNRYDEFLRHLNQLQASMQEGSHAGAE